ncbi:serine hydrolase domain-containing protein [Stenotrophomonas tuberculopleuritidis]|uniref:serine hydrolase domain-containing protein n=1 Tax=Stenotrophomonas tuberculopleuritidis TaxID=3055079 RepID=UPI0026E554E6|nr:serine hydrolase domain-containing protein [Stenotrophomonas sp. 704A1]
MKRLVLCSLLATLAPFHAMAMDAGGEDSARFARAMAHGLRPSTAALGAAVPQWSIQERLAHYKVPGAAVAVIRNGEVVYAAGYGRRQAGTGDAVDADTVFSVGSVSKMGAAATALKLVATGQVTLEEDIDRRLRRWHVPVDAQGRRPTVNLRTLLSHTAGFNVHGFQDYLPDERLPTLLQTLEGRPPAKNEPVRLIHAPGQQVDYSGGGYTVVQLAIEDLTGSSFADVAQREVFAPLGMSRSTYRNPLPADYGNVAHAHDNKGQPQALPRGWQSFPEQAASGLWTSAHDMGLFVAALLRSIRSSDGWLPQPLALQMVSEVAPAGRGLGPELAGSGAARRFFHNGSNDSYHAGIEGYPESGDGFVILTNGDNGPALRGEIRNALSDALGHNAKPVIRTLDPALLADSYPRFNGRFLLDDALPMEVRSGLADWFDADTLDVETAEGGLQLRLPGRDRPIALQPLTPVRFLAVNAGAELLFHRGGDGTVQALSVIADGARAYYRRTDASPPADR